VDITSETTSDMPIWKSTGGVLFSLIILVSLLIFGIVEIIFVSNSRVKVETSHWIVGGTIALGGALIASLLWMSLFRSFVDGIKRSIQVIYLAYFILTVLLAISDMNHSRSSSIESQLSARLLGSFSIIGMSFVLLVGILLPRLYKRDGPKS